MQKTKSGAIGIACKGEQFCNNSGIGDEVFENNNDHNKDPGHANAPSYGF